MMNKTMWIMSLTAVSLGVHADAVTDLKLAIEKNQGSVSALVADAVKQSPKQAEVLVTLAVKSSPDQASEIALAAAKANPHATLTVAKAAFCNSPRQAGAIAKALPQAQSAMADWVCVASQQPVVGEMNVAESTQNGATAANNSTLLLQSGSESQVNSARMYQQIMDVASPNQPN